MIHSYIGYMYIDEYSKYIKNILGFSGTPVEASCNTISETKQKT